MNKPTEIGEKGSVCTLKGIQTVKYSIHKLFENSHRRLCESGLFRINPHCGRDRISRTLAVEGAVDEAIERNPRISTRTIAHHIGIHQNSLWRALYEQFFHPYHFQRVQTLVPEDDLQWMNFVRWFLQRSVTQQDFLACILFTDEATFFSKGVVNARNMVQWECKSYACRATTVQYECMGRHRRGLPNRAIHTSLKTRRSQLKDFLLEYFLPELLHDVPSSLWDLIWFQHDGATSHFSYMLENIWIVNFQTGGLAGVDPLSKPSRSPICFL